VSYTGTIVGVVMALCAVCKYLLSDNLATLLDFWTNKLDWNGWTYIMTTLLQFLSLIILFGPIRREFRDSDILQRASRKLRSCCSKSRKDGDDETFDNDEDGVPFNNTQSVSGSKRFTSGNENEGFSTEGRSK